MFKRILFLALPLLGQSQLIRMAVCSDNSCSKDCVYWNTESGKCAPCDKLKGECYALNPSSITTANSITFYSDYNCAVSNVIPGMGNIPITLDNSCNKLVSSGKTVGSYRATNLSLAIGLSVGVTLTLIICCMCCCWKLKCCCFSPIAGFVPSSASAPGSTAVTGITDAPTYYPPNVGYNANAAPATWASYNTTVVPTPAYYPPGYGYQANTNATYPQYNMGTYPDAGQNVYPNAGQNVYPNAGQTVYHYGGQTAYPVANRTVYYEDPMQPKGI